MKPTPSEVYLCGWDEEDGAAVEEGSGDESVKRALGDKGGVDVKKTRL